MKKLIALTLLLTVSITTLCGFRFPEPDWGALLNEKRRMVTTTDFELYVEGNPLNTPYFGARLEPRSGAYIGMACDYAEGFLPLGSYLTYIESYQQDDLYYPTNYMVQRDDVVTMAGWTIHDMHNVDYNAIRRMLNQLNSYGKPIFVRFANEMNVSALGDDPNLYINVFRTVANMIHEYDNLAVVWSPNDLGALDRPFEYFYPGDEYVDWVGVSCYMEKYFMGNPNTSEKDKIYFMTDQYSWATNKIKPIVEFMEKNNIKKPLMISEGGVTTHGKTGENFADWHRPRLRNMLWSLIMKYPQIKMINYFNVPRSYEYEEFDISNYPESVNIFKEAAASGAYLRTASATPDFAFTPANWGDTLRADAEGFVDLYTLAYIANQPELTVNYKIDGVWFAASNQIPYRCRFDVHGITDGKHTLTISSYGQSKDYTLYKEGNYISFGAPPVISAETDAWHNQAGQSNLPTEFAPPPKKPGDIINEVLHTDIKAYIDDCPIRSFNIDGYTAVVAEDLTEFGFHVAYYNDTRSLYIDEGNGIITSDYRHVPNTMPVGSKAMDVLYTDIKTFANGQEITGHNVNGYTIVFLDDLKAFGTTYWNPEKRAIGFYRWK